jgi:SAM-dependent methyltransferase
VTVVEAAADGTSLPEECCDVIFMRDVYHHFNDPAAINDSLRRSLKPCGRLAILDFRPSGTESSTPAGRSGTTHGVAMRTASDELGRAGLEILQEDAFSGRNFLILARRPGSDGDPARTCPGPSPK